MLIISSVIMLIIFSLSAVFTDSSVLLCVIGIIVSAAGFIFAIVCKDKLKKPLFNICSVLIAAVCLTLCLFTRSVSAEGTKLQRNELLQAVRDAAQIGDTEALKDVYTTFSEKYGETDDVLLLAADCYLNAADLIDANGEEKDKRKQYQETANTFIKRTQVKTSMNYYMTNGHYLESEPAAFVRVNNWLEAVKRYPMWDNANLMVALSLRHDGSTDYTMIQYYTDMAVRINPNNALALAYMGVVRYEMGMYDSALAYLKQAEKVGGDDIRVYSVTQCYRRLIEEAGK